jgi:hypothetical protein
VHIKKEINMNTGFNLKGAIVFLAAFLLFLVISLGYSGLPPGRQIYDAAVGAESDYLVSGIPVTLLAIGIFNGVIWGFIIYIVYWVLDSYVFKKEPTATVKVKAT